jgi:amino acid transporter
MGLIDRIIRIVLAVVVGIFILTGQLTGVAAVILGILAVVFLLTSAVAFCPLYVPFRISTKKKE